MDTRACRAPPAHTAASAQSPGQDTTSVCAQRTWTQRFGSTLLDSPLCAML